MKMTPIQRLILNALHSDNPERAVYDLLNKAYNDGRNRGREEAMNEIFTYHPEED